MIHQAEFEEVIGKENICANVQEALRRAEEVYEGLEAKFVGEGLERQLRPRRQGNNHKGHEGLRLKESGCSRMLAKVSFVLLRALRG